MILIRECLEYVLNKNYVQLLSLNIDVDIMSE